MSRHASSAVVEALRRQIAQWERSSVTADSRPISIVESIDQILPHRGLLPGTIVEWLGIGAGSGAETLALVAARQACARGGALVVIERRREFYPPAAVRSGVPLDRLVMVRALAAEDFLWTLDQSLRCRGVSAVLARVAQLSSRDFRRLQLAAEEGQTLGLLVRPERASGEPSWADVRLLVKPLPCDRFESVRRWKITVLQARGGASGSVAEVDWDE